MPATEHDAPEVPRFTSFSTGVNDQMSTAQANETFKATAHEGQVIGSRGEKVAFGKKQLTVAYDQVAALQAEHKQLQKAEKEREAAWSPPEPADDDLSGVAPDKAVFVPSPALDEIAAELKKANDSLRKVVEASSDLYEDNSKFKVLMSDVNDRSLISRSVASTAVDRLVGLQTTAEEKFGIDENGKVIGLSVQADGAGVRSEYKFPGESESRTSYLDIDYSDPRIQRGLHDLQAMDYITGQIDRHAGNIFVDPQSGKVTGIDNDLSFPDLDRDEMFKRNKQLGDKVPAHLPNMMHEETARRIMAISPDSLRKTLEAVQDPNGEGKLDDYQIGCAVVRLEQLQQAIRDPQSVETGFKIVDQFDATTYQEAMAAQDYNGKWSVSCSSYLGTVKLEQLAVAQKVAENSPVHGLRGADTATQAEKDPVHAEYAKLLDHAKATLKSDPRVIADPGQQQQVVGLQRQIAEVKEKIGHYDRETARLEAAKPGAVFRSLASGGVAERKEFYSEKKIEALQKVADLERELDSALDTAVSADVRLELKVDAGKLAASKVAEMGAPAPALLSEPPPPSEIMEQVADARRQALNCVVVKLHQDIDAMSGYAAAMPQYATGQGQGLTQQLKKHLPAEVRDANQNVSNWAVKEFVEDGPNYKGGDIPINDRTLALRDKILEANEKLTAAYDQMNNVGNDLAQDYTQIDRISLLLSRNQQIDQKISDLKNQQAEIKEQVDALDPAALQLDSLKPDDQSLQKQLAQVNDALAAAKQFEGEKRSNLQALDKLVTQAANDIHVPKKAVDKPAHEQAANLASPDRSYVAMSEADIDKAISEHTTAQDFDPADVAAYWSVAGIVEKSALPKDQHHPANKSAIEIRLIETKGLTPLKQRIEAAEKKLEALEGTAGMQANDPQIVDQKAELDALYEDLDGLETRVDTLKSSLRTDSAKNRLAEINAQQKVLQEEASRPEDLNISSSSSAKGVSFANDVAKGDDHKHGPRQEHELKVTAALTAKALIGKVPAAGIAPAILQDKIKLSYGAAYQFEGAARVNDRGDDIRQKGAGERGISEREKAAVAAEMQPVIDQVNDLQKEIAKLEAQTPQTISAQLAADPSGVTDPQTRQDLEHALQKQAEAEATISECDAELADIDRKEPRALIAAVIKHGSVDKALENLEAEKARAEQRQTVASAAKDVILEKAIPVKLQENQAVVKDLAAQQNKLLQDFHDNTQAVAASIKPDRAVGENVILAHDKLEADLLAVDAQLAEFDQAEAKLQTEVAALEQHQADLKQTTKAILKANPQHIANDETRQAMRQAPDQETQAALFEQLRNREELETALQKQDSAAARLQHCEKQLQKLDSPGIGDRLKAVAQHGGVKQAREHYQNEIAKAQQSHSAAGAEIDHLLDKAADTALAKDPVAVQLDKEIQDLRQQQSQLIQKNQGPKQALLKQKDEMVQQALSESQARTEGMLERTPEKSSLKQGADKNQVNRGTVDNEAKKQANKASLAPSARDVQMTPSVDQAAGADQKPQLSRSNSVRDMMKANGIVINNPIKQIDNQIKAEKKEPTTGVSTAKPKPPTVGQSSLIAPAAPANRTGGNASGLGMH